MVIDSNNTVNTGSTTGARNRTTATGSTESRATAPAAPERASQEDQVVLSAQAQGLSQLQSRIADLPEVDSERVASLRQAIAEGRFEINAERIAENLLKQDELLG